MKKKVFLIVLSAVCLVYLAPHVLAGWSSTKRLTWTSGDSAFPAVAMDLEGTIHIVWHDATPGNTEIYYRRSSDGGDNWSTAQRITWTSGNSGYPAIAIDSSGAVHVAWSDSTPGSPEIYYKNSPDGGSTWGVAQRITWNSGFSSYPEIAVGSGDDLHVVWQDITSGTNQIYYKQSTDGGETWNAARRINWSSGSSEHPALAVDLSGALHVLWSQYVVASPEIYYKGSPDGGETWGTSKRLTWTSGNSSRPDIAVDSSNDLHAVWNEWTSSNTEIYYRKSTDGGANWSALRRLTWTSGGSYVPAMAIRPPSVIYVVWYDDTPGNFEIYCKLSKDGGTTWSGAERLTWTPPGSHLPVIAVDLGGVAHVFWQEESATAGNEEIFYKKSN
jgi:BNR repeat-containing family member